MAYPEDGVEATGQDDQHQGRIPITAMRQAPPSLVIELIQISTYDGVLGLGVR
jgi:hypothetical protein